MSDSGLLFLRSPLSIRAKAYVHINCSNKRILSVKLQSLSLRFIHSLGLACSTFNAAAWPT